MISGILCSLFGAWFLTLFGFNTMCVEVFQPMVTFQLTDAHYYMMFVIVGLIMALVLPKKENEES